MSLIKNINGSSDDNNKMIEELRHALMFGNGNPIEIFPGIAIDGYVEEGFIFAEELYYEEIDRLKDFRNSYELIDYLIIVNPQFKNIANSLDVSWIVESALEHLYVCTFSKNYVIKSKMIKYYDYILETFEN